MDFVGFRGSLGLEKKLVRRKYEHRKKLPRLVALFETRQYNKCCNMSMICLSSTLSVELLLSITMYKRCLQDQSIGIDGEHQKHGTWWWFPF